MFKEFLKTINIAKYLNENPSIEQRLDCVEQLISCAPVETASIAAQLVDSARELFYRQDETGADHTIAIHALLDAARSVAEKRAERSESARVLGRI